MGPEPDPNDPTPGMAIWGWMSPVELNWLMMKASTMESVVEIGCLHGRSAFALLTACPGTVYCIDPWDDDADASYPSFISNCGHFDNVVPVRGRSLDVVSDVADFESRDGKFDMVFIDGAHAYESVLADICAWLPHTRTLICGHDYFDGIGAGYPGVADAVNEVFGDRATCASGTAIWVVDLSADRSINSMPDGPRTWTDEYGRTTTYEFSWPS